MQLLDGAPVYSATDLVGFLACAHRFELERAAMVGLVAKPIRADLTIDLIQERGFEHERRYLDDLRAAGRRIVEIPRDGSAANTREGLREAAELTVQAMRDGADVVYQATFFDGAWRGHADFLLRLDHAAGEPDSALGGWHYEVADTKLARHVKAGAVLQICSYIDQLTRVQGRQPTRLHVALGGSARETAVLRVDDYMAYYRRVKASFLAAADTSRVGAPAYPPGSTYPEPVEHCDVCRWWAVCRDRRRADDDLSLVAGISGRQRRGLKERPADAPPGPVRTRRGLAALQLPVRPRLDGSGDAALARVREQARIQVEGEDRGETLWELLEPERRTDPATGASTLVPDRGFLALPEPSPNDLFLDLEGDPFAFDDGVDYLFGVLDPAAPEDDPRWLRSAPGEEPGAAADAPRADADLPGPDAGAGAPGPNAGRPTRAAIPKFHAFWSRDPAGTVTLAAEKAAFEQLVDLLVARLDADPSLHVYHYAAYEKTALGRLAQRHATREDEVDRLLKGRVLVDLYRVVRQGIRASVESYSIKRLEPLYGLAREVNLKDASSSIVQFEAWLGRGATADGLVGEEILAEIEGYNRDDVLSTWHLRDWLERRRLDLGEVLGAEVTRPALQAAALEPPEPTGRQAAVANVVAALTRDLGDLDPASVESAPITDAQRAAWLLAQLLTWHRRENKAFWWRYYELCGMADEDLVDAREAIGMVGLVADLGSASKAGARLQRFRFPPQDHAAKVGRRVDDPRVQASVGTIREIDEVGGTLLLYRTAAELARGIPGSLIPYEFVPTTVIEDSLLRVGQRAVELGAGQGTGADDRRGMGDPGPVDRAARELLLRRPPRIEGSQPGSPLRADGETALVAATRLVLDLDGTTLAIQGPPGSGKTYTGARMILALVAAGRSVGVTGNSHKVIGNVLDAVHAAALEPGSPVREVSIGQKPGMGEPPTCRHAQDLASWDAAKVAAALRARILDVVGGTAWLWSAPALEGSVDVLVVDEAGQMSLANTVAVSPAAQSLVLLGDPQQLDQPLKGSHPPGAERSALAHLLAGEPGQPAHATMPPERGLFIEKTWRLHPDVCTFTSEVFYESRLTPEAGRERQSVAGVPSAWRLGEPAFRGAGIRWLPVDHAANAVESPEEAAAIAHLLAELLAPATEARWTNADGVEMRLGEADIVVVAPYNAHVDRIATALRAAGLGGIRVGTVDMFQGQEAPVSIYAMGSSSPQDAPRGMAFLYSLNRLNVATSRARCIAAVVASPALVRVACQTPGQMRLANALCRLVEMAPDGV